MADTGRVVAVGDMAGLARELLQVLPPATCHLPPEMLAELGRKARARVQIHYEIGHVAGLYQAFYDRVVAE